MCSYTLFPTKTTWILPQTKRILPSLCFKRRSELIHILTLKMWWWWHMMTPLGCRVDTCAVKHTQYFRKRLSEHLNWSPLFCPIVPKGHFLCFGCEEGREKDIFSSSQSSGHKYRNSWEILVVCTKGFKLVGEKLRMRMPQKYTLYLYLSVLIKNIRYVDWLWNGRGFVFN